MSRRPLSTNPAKPQIIRVNPDTASLLGRYEDVKVSRGRLLAHQKVRIPPNELLEVKQAIKRRNRRRRKNDKKNLRGEVKEIKRQQRRFEKGERREKDEEEPRIVGDPDPSAAGVNFDPELEKEKERNREREARDNFALEAKKVRLSGQRLDLDRRTEDARQDQIAAQLQIEDRKTQFQIDRERGQLQEDARRFDENIAQADRDRAAAQVNQNDAIRADRERLEFERTKQEQDFALGQDQISNDIRSRAIAQDEAQRQRAEDARQRAADRDATERLQVREHEERVRDRERLAQAYDSSASRAEASSQRAFDEFRQDRAQQDARVDETLRRQEKLVDGFLDFARSTQERETIQREAQRGAEPPVVNVFYGSDPNQPAGSQSTRLDRSLSIGDSPDAEQTGGASHRSRRQPSPDVSGRSPRGFVRELSPEPEEITPRTGLRQSVGVLRASLKEEVGTQTDTPPAVSTAEIGTDPLGGAGFTTSKKLPGSAARRGGKGKPQQTQEQQLTRNLASVRSASPTRRSPTLESQIEQRVPKSTGFTIGQRAEPEPSPELEQTTTIGRAARGVAAATIDAGRGLATALGGGATRAQVARVPIVAGEQSGGLGVAIPSGEGGAVAEGVFGGGQTPEGFQVVGGGSGLRRRKTPAELEAQRAASASVQRGVVRPTPTGGGGGGDSRSQLKKDQDSLKAKRSELKSLRSSQKAAGTSTRLGRQAFGAPAKIAEVEREITSLERQVREGERRRDDTTTPGERLRRQQAQEQDPLLEEVGTIQANPQEVRTIQGQNSAIYQELMRSRSGAGRPVGGGSDPRTIYSIQNTTDKQIGKIAAGEVVNNVGVQGEGRLRYRASGTLSAVGGQDSYMTASKLQKHLESGELKLVRR